MAMKKCKECGKDLSSSAKICPNCGKKLKMSLLAKIGVGIGILFIIGIMSSVENKSGPSSSTSDTSDGSASTQAKAEVVQAKVGDVVGVGNFIYRVDDIAFRKSIGNGFINKTADGVFLLVKLTIKNIDKEAHTLDNSLFKLNDDQGNEYESSTEGSTTIEMTGGKTLFLKQCQPNIQTAGFLIFEVPSKSARYHLRVSGGFWSGKTGNITLVKSTRS